MPKKEINVRKHKRKKPTGGKTNVVKHKRKVEGKTYDPRKDVSHVKVESAEVKEKRAQAAQRKRFRELDREMIAAHKHMKPKKAFDVRPGDYSNRLSKIPIGKKAVMDGIHILEGKTPQQLRNTGWVDHNTDPIMLDDAINQAKKREKQLPPGYKIVVAPFDYKYYSSIQKADYRYKVWTKRLAS